MTVPAVRVFAAGGPAGTNTTPTDPKVPAGRQAFVAELAALADDPHSDDNDILSRLEELSRDFSIEEVFAVLVRKDMGDLIA